MDTPLPVDAFPGLTWRQLQRGSIPEYIHLASPETQPALVWEFNKAYASGGLHRLSAVALVHAFVNLPLEIEPRDPREILPRSLQQPEHGFYAFFGPQGNYALTISARHRLPPRTVRHLPKAGSFRLKGDGIDWVQDARLARSRSWFPDKEAPRRGVSWITEEQDGDRSARFEAAVRVEGSRMLGCGKVMYTAPESDGVGRIGFDLTDAYSRDAAEPIRAERHIAVDYSGKSGAPMLMAIVDRIKGGGQKTFVLPSHCLYAQANGKRYRIYRTQAKGTETLGEQQGSLGERGKGNRVWYSPHSSPRTHRNASMQLCFASPSVLELVPFHTAYGRGMNKSPTIMGVSHEKNVDYFVVLTVQPDDAAAPAITAAGEGLDSVVTVGNRKVRFDGKRILIED